MRGRGDDRLPLAAKFAWRNHRENPDGPAALGRWRKAMTLKHGRFIDKPAGPGKAAVLALRCSSIGHRCTVILYVMVTGGGHTLSHGSTAQFATM